MPIIAAIGAGLAAVGGGSALAGAAIAGSVIAGGASLINNANTNEAISDAAATQAGATAQARQYQNEATQRAEGTITTGFNDAARLQNDALAQQTALLDRTRDSVRGAYDEATGREQASITEQRALYDQSRQGLETAASGAAEAYKPYTTTGGSALNALARNYGLDYVENGQTVKGTGQADFSAFEASPDYNFRRNEGLRDIVGASSSQGLRDSGAAEKAKITYASNLASGEYGSYISRLQALANTGLSATNSAVSTANSYAGQIAGVDQAKAGVIGQSANNLTNLQNSYAGQLGALNTAQAGYIGSNANNVGNLGNSYASTLANLTTGNASNNANLSLAAGDSAANAALIQAQNNGQTVGTIAGLTSGLINNTAGLYKPKVAA